MAEPGRAARGHAPDDDDALLARAAGGDADAFARLVESHGHRIAAVARRMLGPGGDVDDVVQDTFLRLWRQAPAWQPGRARLSTWLYRVTSNLCIDRLRTPTRAPLDQVAEPADPTPRADALGAAAEAARAVERALQGLPDRQRLAIVLCHYEGISNIEAAATMGVSVEALESLLARGRRALKTALDGDREWLIAALAEGGVHATTENEHG